MACSDEVVVFSWIAYTSRAHRDRVNKKVMADPRLKAMMDTKAIPFDGKRMIYGGFSVLVQGCAITARPAHSHQPHRQEPR